MYRLIITLFAVVFASLNVSQAQCTLFFSEYAEGSSNNKYLEIYNPTDADISLDGYAYPSVSNAPTTIGVHEYWNTFDVGAVIAAGDVYVIAHGSSDAAILEEADEFHTYLSNGDDGYALVQGIEGSYTVLDMIGDFNGDPGSGWEVAGISNATKDHTLVRKESISQGNAGDWTTSAGTNVDDSEWVVLDQNTWTYLGSHAIAGSCGAATTGCTNGNASNYDSSATEDDGSCEFNNACNVDGVEVESFTYEYSPADLSVEVGALVTWTNTDGFHNVNGDINSITGESFGNPESFFIEAISGDASGVCIGSHTFNTPGVYAYDCSIGDHALNGMLGTITVGTGGCTTEGAPNYNEAADFDDGSCEESQFTSIADIQQGQEQGLYTDQVVNTSGIVTGVFGSSVSVQDGTGAYSGIWMYGSDVSVQVGDEVSITATVVEYNDLTQLSSPAVIIISPENDLPVAELLVTAAVVDEQWEGVLVHTSGEVDDDALGFGEWSLTDGNGSARAGDKGYDAIGAGLVSVGVTVDVVGPLDYNYGNYKIQPRDEADVMLHGCMNNTADNYNSSASIDDSSCEFVGSNDCSVFISEYGEGSSYNKYIELHNPTSSPVFLDQYSYHRCTDGCDDFEYPHTFVSGAQIAPGGTYILAHSSSDATITNQADEIIGSWFNGNDVWALTQTINNEIVVVDIIGDFGPDPGNGGWDVAGEEDATKDHTLVRKSTVFQGNLGDWAMSSGTNEFDSEWIVLNVNDWSNLGTHSLTVGCNINTGGCTDDGAINFDPNALTDDGSCEFAPNFTVQEIHSSSLTGLVVTNGIVTAVITNPGYTDALGTNASYVIQNNTGPFSAIWCVGGGVSVGDFVNVSGSVVEQNGLLQIQGATADVISSLNTLPLAEALATNAINDEQWESVLLQIQAPVDNIYPQYFEWSLDEGEGSARVDDLAYNALGDSIDVDGVLVPLIELGVTYRVTGPNLFSFGDWKLIPRDTSDVVRLGCMDSAFPNYDALASEDDGSCANIEGCMDPLADNYNSNATFDDGSCVISGCTDGVTPALNYNSAAVTDDGSCYYFLPNIIINEIHYNPCPSQSANELETEFIELLNIGDLPADLSGYKILNGETTVGLTFPSETIINAGEFVILTAEIGSVNYLDNGYQVFVLEVASLSNSGQSLSLVDAWNNDVDVVDYDDSGAWPSDGFSILGSVLIASPDDGCASLEYIPEVLVEYQAGAQGMDNAIGSNWQASWVDGGTPGAPNSSAFGCNDATACNYNPTAYIANNAICAYDCYGCTYLDAENFTNGATFDDGTCTFSIAVNDCPADLNGDGSITTGDLLIFLSEFGENCE